MYRHLYKKTTIFSKILQSEFQNYKCEELGFRYAALAKLRENYLNDKNGDFYQQWEELHEMSMEEQWTLSKFSILPQLFKMFSNLHKVTRQSPVIQHPRLEAISKFTALLDPDMFPVLDLKEKLHVDKAVSVWEDKNVPKDIGFELQVRESSIQHIEAGNGVFLRTFNGESLPPGTLLALVPGVMYNNYDEIKLNDETHFFRFDGKLFNFGEKIFYPILPGLTKIEYEQKITKIYDLTDMMTIKFKNAENGGFERVLGQEINPYAVGHLINHTPRDKETNVCLIDLFIPKKFFPENLMKFWPCITNSNVKDPMNMKQFQHHLMSGLQKDHIRGLGVISVKQIQDGEELFLDYFDSALFQINANPPEWLIKPPPLLPHLVKGYYEHQITFLNKILESFLFMQTEDGTNYEAFINKVQIEKQLLDTINQ